MKEAAEKQRDEAGNLETLYVEALRDYLAGAGEGALRRAYEVGRLALAQGLGVLQMAALHHSSLAKVLPAVRDSEQEEGVLKAAAEFFSESLSPYEMAHRGFREAVSALRHVNETLEQEIKRIAHAVHDEAGQLLVAVRLAMSELARDLPPPLQSGFQEIMALLNQIEEQLRRLSHELRPTVLDDLGLAPAIQFLAEGVSKRAKLPIRVEAALDGRVSPTIDIAVYRIIQEALTNVTKHSQARTVKVQLKRDARNLCCSVQDDGVGFDVPSILSRKDQRGLGLVGIQERLNALGGTLGISSAPGRGTQLLITIPVEN